MTERHEPSQDPETGTGSLPDPGSRRVLVVSLAPYRYATRARKAARSLTEVAEVHYLAPAAVGRTGHWDEPGRRQVDGIDVLQVPVPTPRSEPTPVNQVVNLTRSYLPALARLTRQALRTPADVVFVNGPPLAVVGWLHHRRFGSVLVLDIHERPGMVTTRGSLFSVFARGEQRMLRRLSAAAAMATVATHADVDLVRSLGFARVVHLRNAPLDSWRAPYRPPDARDGRPLRLVLIGSIFEGRGYEALLEALARASQRVSVTLDLYGPGRESYLAQLRALSQRLGVADLVSWRGRLGTEEVSAAYLAADIGLVLYDPANPGNDGLSNKILECVSSGRPVIATDLPENRRFVTTTGCGWLTRMSADEVAATIVRAASGSELDEVTARCRDLAGGALTWETDFAPVSALVTAQDRQ